MFSGVKSLPAAAEDDDEEEIGMFQGCTRLLQGEGLLFLQRSATPTLGRSARLMF